MTLLRSLILCLSLGALSETALALPFEEESDRTAVRWLAEWCEEQLADSTTSRSVNELAKERAVLCLFAFLLELHPDPGLADVELREAVVDRLIRFAQGERSAGEDALETWNQAFCALALVERAQRGATDGDALSALVSRIEAGQRSDGGWGHGFRGSVASYPSTLIAATNGSMLALGLFERLGLPVNEKRVERGLQLYQSVQAGTGAFPYGGPLHRTNFEAGRTAGAFSAMTALGRTDEEVLRCTADYLFVNVHSIPEGHGSPAFHIFEGALAFHTLGEEAWSRYSEAILDSVRAVARADGSFDDLYEFSPDSHPAMGSDELNRAYRTALYAAALSIPRSVTAIGLREYGENRLPVIVSRHDPNKCCLVWRHDLDSAEHLFSSDGIVAVVEESGRVGFRSAAGGELLREVEHELDCDFALAVSFVEQNGERLLVHLAESRAEDYDEDALAARVFRAGESEKLGRSFIACFSIPEMSLLWNRELETEPFATELAPGKLYTLGMDGGLCVLDAKTGELTRCRSALPSLTTCVIESDPNGELYLGTDSHLQCQNFEKGARWTRSLEANPDATPPSWTALLGADATLWTGATDGLVRGLDPATGKTQFEISLRSAVRDLIAVPGQEGLVLALTGDGRICALSRGALAWEIDLAGGHEWRGRARAHLDGEQLWIAHEGHGSVRSLDLKSGEVVGEYALPDGAAWTIVDGHLIHAVGDRLISLK